MMIPMSVLRAKIARAVEEHGSQKALAEAMGIQQGFLSEILGSSKPISDTVANKFGYRLVERQYVKIGDAK